MAENQFQTYLDNQSQFREKWRTYLNQSPDFDLSDRLEVLTPFHGTSDYEKLSSENKNDLFLNHVRLMAEALIVFEQILLFGYYTNRNKPSYEPESFAKPFAQFTFEELYHSMAFKHFLSSHEVFRKFPKTMITEDRWLKNTFAWIVRQFPGALYICSPRLEALSLSYYNEIKEAHPKTAENSWLQLHKLHHQDEIYHIPLNYHFHDAFIKEHGFLKTFVGSVLFFMMMQVMLMKVAFAAISQALPEKGTLSRVMWTLKYIKWSMKVAKAHKDARTIMKRNFNKMKPRYSLAFYFLIK